LTKEHDNAVAAALGTSSVALPLGYTHDIGAVGRIRVMHCDESASNATADGRVRSRRSAVRLPE
jgi:hypothetical protein